MLSPRRWGVEVALSALFGTGLVEVLISSERRCQGIGTGWTVTSSVCGGSPDLDATLGSRREDRLQIRDVVLWSIE